MDIDNGNKTKLKTETIDYKKDNNYFIFTQSFNSEEIIINIKNGKSFQYNEYESKFNFTELTSIHIFFTQFKNVEMIGNLFLNLLKGNKVTLYEKNNSIIFSFLNITEEEINIPIKKKQLTTNETIEKLTGIVESLIKDIDKIKKENIEMKEEINLLKEFKIKIEKEKEIEKYFLKKSSIIIDINELKMISNWINPNKEIHYTQIYKATKDGGTGNDFHRCCDNKKPTLTLIKTTNNYIFGGYISISWEGPSNWTYKGNDDSAFIFSVNNKLKFPIQNKEKVIYNQKDYGPDFGDNDIYLNNKDFLNNDSVCYNYPQYKAPPEKLAGGSSFRIKELEVYLVEFD